LDGECNGFASIDGQKFWGIQRIFLVLLNFSVGIALLSNISVVPSWNIVETFELEFSGLSPINSSLSTFNSPLDYWAWLYSLLSTPNYVITVPPTRCSLGLQCQSYYLSGSIYNQIPSASSFVDRPEASFFIVEDSVGYQIDYYPPLLTDNLQGAICATYADSGNWTALQICIKQSGNDLLAGLSYCSSNGSIPECLANQTQWTDNYNSILKVTISQRLSSVHCSLFSKK
jgi:hypothetical protein